MQVGKKLSELIRDISSQASGTGQNRWQTELTQAAIELISVSYFRYTFVYEPAVFVEVALFLHVEKKGIVLADILFYLYSFGFEVMFALDVTAHKRFKCVKQDYVCVLTS